MLVTDVNGDGLNDIITGNGHGYGLYWFEQRVDGQGKRTFQRHAIEEHYGNFHTMTLADVNGDGKPDLVTGKRLFGHDGRDEGEWDPLFLFWYDIQGGKFERHVISFNNLQYYPGQENVNEPPQFAAEHGHEDHRRRRQRRRQARHCGGRPRRAVRLRQPRPDAHPESP